MNVSKKESEKKLERLDEKMLSLQMIFSMRKSLIEKYPSNDDKNKSKYIESNELLIDSECRIWEYIETGNE